MLNKITKNKLDVVYGSRVLKIQNLKMYKTLVIGQEYLVIFS